MNAQLPISVPLASPSDFSGWRSWSRQLLHDHVPGTDIDWQITPPADLYAPVSERSLPQVAPAFAIPRDTARLISAVFASGHPERFSLLYRLLEHYRDTPAQPVEPDLLGKLQALAAQARAQALELRACLPPPLQSTPAFRHVQVPVPLLDSQASALWRLRPQPWLIHTPGRLLLCENSQIIFAPEPPSIPDTDTGPEAQTEKALFLHDFAQRHGQSAQHSIYWRGVDTFRLPPAPEEIDQASSLHALRCLAVDCAFCPLSQAANRTVFGEGATDARLIFVGEQPGDQEDLTGRPFVGPAGQLFDQALQEAGGQRGDYWLTNAVKHFRFIQTPARRLHQKPEAQHVQACAPWLAAERRLLAPQVTVMLGVTAASAILGRPVTISRERSRLFDLPSGGKGLVTVHPSFLLRVPDPQRRAEEYRKFVTDLKLALSALAPDSKEE
ncbi:UdgX family uracil-DNA binding protein [Oecophyllibacter saccharovorans]|uniref:UdgX family uracil-DNA binding protein n=1 Tax=Oecophyllibacter saccharovorans TaxID=2558360 RepID=UPI001170AABB|nr:UdgX family uracil-DNA binding protein [Oecophyllibacter saccharovorans]TPW34851.1 uracil-DNA glycosylase [Oecophyllibacter saccharovorans]